MGRSMFWAEDDLDLTDLISYENYQIMEIDSMLSAQKQIQKATGVQEKKSDQSFSSDSPSSDSPDSLSSCPYIGEPTTSSSQIVEEAPQCFYPSPSNESFMVDHCASETDFEFIPAGGLCSNCKTSTADTCIVHHQGRHLDVCITCAAHCFKFRMPCPLCQLPIVYIYRYNNV